MIRGTGLVERVEAGVADGGLEVAGVFDDVPQDSSTDVVERCAAAAQGGGRRLVPRRRRRLGDGHRQGRRRGLHPRRRRRASRRASSCMPREDDGMGRPLDIAPLACIPTTAGTGSEVSMAAVIKDPEREGQARDRGLPAVPAAGDPRPRVHRARCRRAIAAATGMDAMTHAIEGYVSTRLEPAPGRPLAAGAADDPRQPRARRAARRRTRTRAGTC